MGPKRRHAHQAANKTDGASKRPNLRGQQPRRPNVPAPTTTQEPHTAGSARDFGLFSLGKAKEEVKAQPDDGQTPRPHAEGGQKFATMQGMLNNELLEGLENMSFTYMSPVQQKVLTELPSVTKDCLVQAKTGTGKTIAFLLPAIQNLLNGNRPPRGQVAILVICPTRELATQIAKEAEGVTARLSRPMQCHTAYGGTGRASALQKFLNGDPTILVATPGRLNDYLGEEAVRDKFTDIKTVVLDEADRMLDEGFGPDVKRILNAIPPKSTGWQGMCFSATLPEKVKSVVKGVLLPDYTHLSTMDGNETPTIAKVPQYVVSVPSIEDTFRALYALLVVELSQDPKGFKTIVFGQSANGVGLLHDMFERALPSLPKFELHSRMNQNQRTRTTEAFKTTQTGLMFASDVVGRGMDFPNVGLVVQLGMPANADQYIHRVGRTARAGKDGRAVIILYENEQFFIKVNKALPINPYPMDIAAQLPKYQKDTDALLNGTDEKQRFKAYQGWLGFNKPFMNKMRVDPEGLVKLANQYASAMQLPEPPELEKKVIGKMGLKGVRGLRISKAAPPPRTGVPPPRRGAPANAKAPGSSLLFPV